MSHKYVPYKIPVEEYEDLVESLTEEDCKRIDYLFLKRMKTPFPIKFTRD